MSAVPMPQASVPQAAPVAGDVHQRLVEHLSGGFGPAFLTGAAGLGVSRTLETCLEALDAQGTEVEVLDVRGTTAGAPVHDAAGRGAGGVLVLDARQCHDVERVRRAVAAAGSRGADWLLVCRNGPDTDAVLDLAREHGAAPFVLRPWGVDQVAAALRQRGIPGRDAAEVARLTGGLPWLVRHVGARPDDDPLAPGPGAPAPARVRSYVLGLLDGCTTAVADTVLALAVGYPVGGRPALPGAPADDAAAQDHLVRRVEAAGLLGPDGQLPPLVRACLLEHAPPHRLRRWREQLVEDVLASGEDLGRWAGDLVDQGVHDPRVVAALVERVTPSDAGTPDGAAVEQPAEALRLLQLAARAGGHDQGVRVQLARLALLNGDVLAASREIDAVLAETDDAPPAPDLLQVGLDVALAADQPHRVEDLVQWVRSRDPSVADHPAVALSRYLGGDLRGGDEVLDRTRAAGNPALSAQVLLAEGVRASIGGSGPAAGALPRLMLALEAASAASAPSPSDCPTAAVALWGLHAGDHQVVRSVLGAALADAPLGVLAQGRRRLLGAWADMTTGDLDRAREVVDALSADDLAPRDRVWLVALRVGLARRADDHPGLRAEWGRAREELLRHPVSLGQLLPLGELSLAAARLHDFDVIRPQWDRGRQLLADLGEPDVWATPYHWYAVQVALQRDDPRDLAPHAAALSRAAGRWERAAVLSAAGRTWVRVRARDVVVAEVESAARGLARAGLAWEGARLAAHGSAVVVDRRDSARLLECARDLQPASSAGGGPDAAAPRAATGPAPSGPGGARERRSPHASGLQLTDREWQVAELVVAGKTYREVGASLYLSAKTVEHHVARIRRRSGARTRSELLTLLLEMVDARADRG